MPFRTIPGTETQYGLISFDWAGEERRDDPDGTDGRMSPRLIETAASGDITNIFLFSHGWMGDVPAAIDQYDRWIRAFDTLRADRERAARVFPGFRPLYIGLHWPSLPWGDEEIGDGSFDAEDAAPGPDDLYTRYLERLGDTPEIRSALGTILEDARTNAAAQSLAPHVRDAVLQLNSALGLASEGAAGAPDADREPFDPDRAFGDEVSFGLGADIFAGVRGLLRLCSYWTMKKRARMIGEGGMHDLVKALQRATATRAARVHLMGHSFGCVVVSSILGGPGGSGPLERPIDSVALVQGAVSLWSYASEIPFGREAGYFHRVLADGKVRGPLISTQSSHDAAVCSLYPRASAASRNVSFDPEELPKYGAIGEYGLQGLPAAVQRSAVMLPSDGEYGFEPGRIYNLDSSRFIAKGSGSSGAHNDIDGPEVAHAVWSAALASA